MLQVYIVQLGGNVLVVIEWNEWYSILHILCLNQDYVLLFCVSWLI